MIMTDYYDWVDDMAGRVRYLSTIYLLPLCLWASKPALDKNENEKQCVCSNWMAVWWWIGRASSKVRYM